jgi:hypothetical protein
MKFPFVGFALWGGNPIFYFVSERKIDHNENPFEGNEKFVLFLDELAQNM